MDNVIILTEPKLYINIECPKCNDKSKKAVNIEYVKCNKCKSNFKPVINQRIFSYFLPIIYKKLETENEIMIYSIDKYKSFQLEFKEHFNNLKMFEVSEIEKHRLDNPYFYCCECAYCYNCVKCEDCGKHFVPKKEDKCPKCKSKNLKLTHFESKDDKCIHCGEQKNIKRTKLINTEVCHKCGTKNIKKKEHNQTNRLVISKLKAFRTYKDE